MTRLIRSGPDPRRGRNPIVLGVALMLAASVVASVLMVTAATRRRGAPTPTPTTSAEPPGSAETTRPARSIGMVDTAPPPPAPFGRLTAAPPAAPQRWDDPANQVEPPVEVATPATARTPPGLTGTLHPRH